LCGRSLHYQHAEEAKMGFEDKSPAMQQFLEDNFGTGTAIKELKCVPAPIGCGKAIGEGEFRDALSIKEYRISGLCQSCQDSVFGE
jgi:hypothetical protein